MRFFLYTISPSSFYLLMHFESFGCNKSPYLKTE